MRNAFVAGNRNFGLDSRRSFDAQLHKLNQRKAMLDSVSGIQHRPQLSLRNKEDFVSERILYFGARRETAHIHESLVGRVRAFHKAWLSGNGGAVGIIAFSRLCWRRRSRWRWWRCICVCIFWRRSVWVKWLLRRRILGGSGFSGISRSITSNACWRRLLIHTSRNNERGEQGQR